jgi:hypothetical protein
MFSFAHSYEVHRSGFEFETVMACFLHLGLGGAGEMTVERTHDHKYSELCQHF